MTLSGDIFSVVLKGLLARFARLPAATADGNKSGAAPATERKRRRLRYTSLGVISEERISRDLRFSMLLPLFFYYIPEDRTLFPPASDFGPRSEQLCRSRRCEQG